jgi:hypothetical protein
MLSIYMIASSAENEMANHRNVYNDEQWAELRRGPIAAIYRVSLATTPIAADLAHEFLAADEAIQSLVSTNPKESLISELFEERLSTQELWSMVSKHRSAQKSLDVVMLSARLVRTHHPGDYKSYVDLVMTAARKASEAVKEVSIPWHRRSTETEHRAIDDIEKALSCEEPAGD